MKLKKYEKNPILKPWDGSWWDGLVTCNPGAWYENGTFYLLYRAAGNDYQHKVYFGLATSNDGYNFKRVSNDPVFGPSEDGPDAGCVEDPRIVKFGAEFYVTYAYRPFPPGQYWVKDGSKYVYPASSVAAPVVLRNNETNTGLAVTKDFRTFRRLGRITKANIDDRDVIIFPEKVNGKYVMLHRPSQWHGVGYPCQAPSIWIAFSDDLLSWGQSYILATAKFEWEGKKIGGSTPPIKTDNGWLTLYHGVSKPNPPKNKYGVYRIGVMMLDLNDPRKVVARAPDFIMEPEIEFEINGIYDGGCVFPTGNVVKDGVLYVYYGAADKYCCVATAPLQELVDYVMKYKE